MVRSVLKSVLLLLFALISFAPHSHGGPFDKLPPHVSQSFAFGVTHNSGVSIENIQVMAIAVAKRNLQLSEDDAKTYVLRLSIDEMKNLATQEFQIEYVEIPLKEFQAAGETFYEKSQFLQSEPSPLIFKKNGVDYVRWFFHPLRNPKSFLDYFPKAQIKRDQFVAQMTESRSVVVMDRSSGNFWSMKLSLPEAIGVFVNKTFLSGGALIQLKTSDYLAENNEKNFIFEQEALGIKGVGEFDEGILVRSIQKFFSNGQYMISFSAFYTRGLRPFLKKVLSAAALEKLEDKWLADKPGQAAAERFSAAGLIHHSNHTQNSVLIFSANGMPIKFKQRDADFYAYRGHSKISAQLSSLWFLSFKENFDSTELEFDFSMPNGLKDFHYSYKINQLTYTFFESVMTNWDRIKRKPLKPRNIFLFLNNETYYQYRMPITYLSHQRRQEVEDIYFEQKLRLEARWPELRNMTTDPVGSLRALLLRDNFDIADLSGVFQKGKESYGISFLNAWSEIVGEFMDPNRRETSTVMKVIRSTSEYGFRNFSIMVIYSYEEKFEGFVEELFRVAKPYPQTLEGLSLILNQLQRLQYPGIIEPLYFSRLVPVLRNIMANGNLRLLKCEVIFKAASKGF